MNWVNESVMYNIYPLGFCGAPKDNDFKLEYRLNKIYDWIDNFKKMSINTIVFNPLFESSRHGYDTIDYRKVDSRLGDNNSFKEICKTLHENGIRIILDGVFNHVGRDFFAFKDVQQNKENSKYCGWFENLHFHGNTKYNDGFWYEGWAGHFDLVKLNLNNPDVFNYLLESVEFWIDEFDIDGLRLDAADCIDLDFFKKLKNTCESKKADFWLYGEIVGGDYNKWANKDTLHSVTNYECYKGLYSSHNDHNYFEIAHSLNRQFGDWGIYKNIYTFNFVDNHDVNRIASTLNEQEHLNNIHTILYTMPGVPCIYYGSEWAIKGKRTPHSDYELRPCLDINNIPNPNEKLYNHICKLGKIRRSLVPLKYGTFTNVVIKNEQLLFAREYNNEIVYIALNLSGNDSSVEFDIKYGGKYIDMLSGESYDLSGWSNIYLPPYSSRVLAKEGTAVDFGDISQFNSTKANEVISDKNPIPEINVEVEPVPVRIGKYRHFKGNQYEVIGVAKDSETLEEMVVYKALYGNGELWVRPKEMFEEVIEKDGEKLRRFEPI